MDAIRDYRKQEVDRGVYAKPTEYGGQFTCHDCRHFFPFEEMADSGRDKHGITGHCRCKQCFIKREERILQHTKRIHSEMTAKGLREPELTEAEIQRMLG